MSQPNSERQGAAPAARSIDADAAKASGTEASARAGAPSAPRRGRLGRLLGIDRTGPKPTQTVRGEPLRPLTLPNVVGYLRLAGLPVFLYLAFNSSDGRSAGATILFALVAVGDYLDGFLARVTGQYSRMGALLDPVVDRLTVLCGAAVCWHFHLLPRWALLALVAREVVTLVLGELAVRRGVELEINWPGRAAVWPTMAAIFFAMIFAAWWVTALLLIGIGLGLVATVRYVRLGLHRRGTQANSQVP